MICRMVKAQGFPVKQKAPVPDEIAEQRETADKVLAWLDRLPANQQEVIRLIRIMVVLNHSFQDGWEVPGSGQRRTDLPIVGMTCAGCASRIQDSLGDLDGVSQATVNFANDA